MEKNKSREDVVVLDTNAVINIGKRANWPAVVQALSSSHRVVIPTPVLYEFQLYKHKSSDSEIEFGKFIYSSCQLDCLGFQMAQDQNRLSNGVYVVNPTHREWFAAANRISKHIEERDLKSKGIKNWHMDHIIYSTARNISGTVCTDNLGDFIDITNMAQKIGLHDGEITVKSLTYYLDKSSSGTSPS